ncbi:hypothetical protein MJ563_01395 [Klebsiella pneumoniae]|nr:hypothetical protein MJ563_01395 [Klebsiella pneumoniae]
MPVGHVEAGLRTGDLPAVAGRRQPYVDRPSGDIPFRPPRKPRGRTCCGKILPIPDHGLPGIRSLDALFWVRSGAG